jgi:uncharacterized protein involved in propanediol utilization
MTLETFSNLLRAEGLPPTRKLLLLVINELGSFDTTDLEKLNRVSFMTGLSVGCVLEELESALVQGSVEDIGDGDEIRYVVSEGFAS